MSALTSLKRLEPIGVPLLKQFCNQLLWLGSSTTLRAADASLEPRDSMHYDVCIVGAGPAGLSAAIRLKQMAQEKEQDVSVCVLEKGSEIGAHILSGNVFETRALDELLPAWREEGAPIKVEAKKDKFYFLTEKRAIRLPTPPQMHNKGNYIISLSQLVGWLGTKAEELGVEVYPGFAASEVLRRPDGSVCGVATNDMGIGKDGRPTPSFTRGVELHSGVTLLAEGCRGSLSEWAMKEFKLREQAGACPQTYGLGLKEVWQVSPEKSKPGFVMHSIGYPLPWDVYGGSFLYHMDDNMVALGYVVGLDYENPYLNPYKEFQKFKQHPFIRSLLEGGTCLQYGARALNEGGLQSIPKLTFPGGALIGCSAGFLNVPKIKGVHTAMKSGMLAAEASFQAVHDAKEGRGVDISSYEEAMKESWVWEELSKVRNIRPSFRYGLLGGLVGSAVDTYILRGEAPWTLSHGRPDHEHTLPVEGFSPIDYPKPDGEITFDLNSSLYRSGTNHNHDQPPHLKLKNPGIPESVNVAIYDGPESRYCPAGVYEYVTNENGRKQLQINAQNCLHCKACDIKDPSQNIKWTVPEGGGGPSYTIM